MRKILIVKRRALLISMSLVIIIIGALFIKNLWFRDAKLSTISQQGQPDKSYFEPEKPIEGSLEEIYQDVFMLLLLPSIEESVQDYYMETIGQSPIVDPWSSKVLYIERPNGYRSFLFRVKLEIMPYLGAHNSVGVDHITLEVSTGSVRVEEHQHIKSYPIPPHLR